MALKTFVKVSGVNNLSDARYCAGMGVNQIGFNIEPEHENYTDPQSFKELSDWVSGVEFVGEIETKNSIGKITELIEGYNLKAIQVNHVNFIEEASSTGLEVILYATDVEDAHEVINKYKDKVSYVLLEDDNATQDQLTLLTSLGSVVLATGFDVEDLNDFLDTVQPKGIALKGGNEIRPGFKDFDEMADILEALDADEWA